MKREKQIKKKEKRDIMDGGRDSSDTFSPM